MKSSLMRLTDPSVNLTSQLRPAEKTAALHPPFKGATMLQLGWYPQQNKPALASRLLWVHDVLQGFCINNVNMALFDLDNAIFDKF